MLDKTFEAFSKTMDSLGETMNHLEKEMNDIFKKTFIPKSKKIKIKKRSIVTINGARCTLQDDAIVTTDDPITLMGK